MADKQNPVWARDREVPGECVVCKTKFLGYKAKMYCSKKCQNEAYYKHHRDTINARRRIIHY